MKFAARCPPARRAIPAVLSQCSGEPFPGSLRALCFTGEKSHHTGGNEATHKRALAEAHFPRWPKTIGQAARMHILRRFLPILFTLAGGKAIREPI
jgi:hypothetical protein